MADARMHKVGFIRAYYFPDYVRTKTLLNALKQIDTVRVFEAINKQAGIFRYVEALAKLITIRLLHNPDYYVLGWRGYELFWIVRLLTLGRPLIYDHMMSPYDSLLHETKSVPKNTLLATLLYQYEKAILKHAQVILTDTPLHTRHLIETFSVAPDKIIAVPVGTDEELFRRKAPATEKAGGEFLVFFYGSFRPLHGMDVILEAADHLKGLPIKFLLVGGSHGDLSSFHSKIEQACLHNVVHREWIPYRELPDFIRRADLCLGGPFGNTGQAKRVITGKTFQFMAMAKATVIGALEQDFGFVDKENCLLVAQGNPLALANAVKWAFEHQDSLDAIGEQGYCLFRKQFSTARIAAIIAEIPGVGVS